MPKITNRRADRKKREVDGRAGVLVDGNDSGNFDVLFVDTGVVMNCHPWWRMKYFDANGQEIEHVAVAC